MTVPAPAGERYARHERIAGWDQRILAASTAVVVGVGALGNEVAKNLALAGVGRLVLCDPDTVSVSNLSRTVLLADSDVGRPNVSAAAAAASIASTAIVAGWMTLIALRLLFARAADARTPSGDRAFGDGWTSSGEEATGGEGTPEQGLLRIDGPTGRTGPVAVRRDPGCPHHQPLDGSVTVLPIDEGASVGDLLAALPLQADPRCWAPVALPGRCPRCDTRYEPAPTDESRLLSCRGCGQPHRIRRTDSLLGVDPTRSLRDLGVPSGEILPVRTSDGEFHWYRLRLRGIR
ncbi:HesA/MoeB/ThiF family protein [Frankia gtarii]|uniref:HesA/MoeB/ThiF family protein n=1 Tax=Frankia gtarii TaxID=2950102 RepID=UPI0021C18A07|nr:ThiF family adenylyltransferase [Frankia gtarii]